MSLLNQSQDSSGKASVPALTVWFWLPWNLLCRQGWHRPPRDLPTSASQVLGLKVCTTTPGGLLTSICTNLATLQESVF